jgi:hypothetical protein
MSNRRAYKAECTRLRADVAALRDVVQGARIPATLEAFRWEREAEALAAFEAGWQAERAMREGKG